MLNVRKSVDSGLKRCTRFFILHQEEVVRSSAFNLWRAQSFIMVCFVVLRAGIVMLSGVINFIFNMTTSIGLECSSFPILPTHFYHLTSNSLYRIVAEHAFVIFGFVGSWAWYFHGLRRESLFCSTKCLHCRSP